MFILFIYILFLLAVFTLCPIKSLKSGYQRIPVKYISTHHQEIRGLRHDFLNSIQFNSKIKKTLKLMKREGGRREQLLSLTHNLKLQFLTLEELFSLHFSLLSLLSKFRFYIENGIFGGDNVAKKKNE